MSSDPAAEPDTVSPSPEANAAAASAPSAGAPLGGLAAIVRKTLGDPGENTAGGPPRGERQPRGQRRGPRRPKPPGGDAPGDDGEGYEQGGSERTQRVHVPVPSKRAPLSADLEAEFASILGDVSLDAILDEGGVKKSAERLELDSRHRAQVMKIHGDNVFFSLGGRHEGVASLRSFTDPPLPGDMLDVVVTGRSREDGLHDLAIPGGAVVAGDWTDIREGVVVDAKVTAANTGGLECQVNNLRGFIPAGQISTFRVENLGDFVGQKLTCVVMEANERRGNLILSRRAVMEREKQAAKEKLLAELAPGQTREGIVRKIQDFGAFIDLGGVDGLLHISQLSWERIKHPSQVLTEGQKINVRVERIDPETGKISLGYRSEADDPWKDAQVKFPVGTIMNGTVTRIAEFGAFVKLAPGVEGLVHISELAHHKVYAVKNVVEEGQNVEVKILSLDEENQRISLSLKAALAPKKDDKAEKKEEEVEEPPRQVAVPKRPGPLKGGTARPSGGEQFGLKW